MSESILVSTKKMLGIAEDYTAFDLDVTTFINSALSTLHQLGVGPADGLMITGDTETWADLYAGDNRYNMIKNYVWLRVRVLFDPPATSYLLAAFNQEIAQLEWRMNVISEGDNWVPPTGPDDDEDILVDGGEV